MSGGRHALEPRTAVARPIQNLSGYWLYVGLQSQQIDAVAAEGEIRATPIPIDAPITVSAIGMIIPSGMAGSTGAVIRLGIYWSADGAFTPIELLHDAGTIDGTVEGAQEIAISPSLTIPRGIAYPVAVTQGGATTRPGHFRARLTTQSHHMRNTLASMGNVNIYNGVLAGGVIGALPDPLGATGTTANPTIVGMKLVV